jgi:hypothetical protein
VLDTRQYWKQSGFAADMFDAILLVVKTRCIPGNGTIRAVVGRHACQLLNAG